MDSSKFIKNIYLFIAILIPMTTILYVSFAQKEHMIEIFATDQEYKILTKSASQYKSVQQFIEIFPESKFYKLNTKYFLSSAASSKTEIWYTCNFFIKTPSNGIIEFTQKPVFESSKLITKEQSSEVISNFISIDEINVNN